MNHPVKFKEKGFSLIEVLLALAIIAIAFTALLRGTNQQIKNSEYIQKKLVAHWVAMQAINAIQLGLITTTKQESTHVTTFLNRKCYWRSYTENTPIETMQKIMISVSFSPEGPFVQELIGFRKT